ncbi:hypothetical protein R1sor_011951 [Riccia sorocarpa]|uniref:Reverse transcriptase zinc-binding domain-containing protein n=1 Tax=Riccia sorocarpa TaxID=122646 RepID=A0ABD3I2E7_9MARC
MALLLLSAWRVQEAPTLDKLLRLWFSVRKNLELVEPETLPHDLPIASLKLIWKAMGGSDDSAFQRLERGAKRGRVKLLHELQNASGGLDLQLLPVDNIVTTEDAMEEGVAVRWLTHAEGWDKRWKWLWSGKSLNRHKLWIWKVLNLGLFTFDRAERWGVADGECRWCYQENETVEHLLWKCPRLGRGVSWIQESLAVDGVLPVTLLQAIDNALQRHARQPSALILLGEHFRKCWNERNRYIYDQIETCEPNHLILAEAELMKRKAAWRLMKGEQADLIQACDREFLSTASSKWRELRDRQGQIDRLLGEAAGDPSGSRERRIHLQDLGTISQRSGASTSSSCSSEDYSSDDRLTSVSS